jgi:NMD protein affecting ribosome stability and mRNA decay
MVTSQDATSKTKQCEFCGRPLSPHYEGNLCPHCKDVNLFREVKDFIRSHTVNEYEVSEHFGIPLKQIKAWIREGRIEYRTDDPSTNVSTMHCQRCGAPVTFGTLCPQCLKLLNNGKGTAVSQNIEADSRMHYLDKE